jgi:hypothetical protein
MPSTARSPTSINPHIAADDPARFLQTLCEHRETSLTFRIVCDQRLEHADSPHPTGLLRTRRERPRRNRTPELA